MDIDDILQKDAQRTELIGKVEQLRSKLNIKGKPSDGELMHLQKAKAELEPLENQLQSIDKELNQLLMTVPNLIAKNTPTGGEEANRQEKTWGEAIKKPVKDHVAIAEAAGWLDFERGAKVAGSKFYFLKGPLVKLELSIVRMAMDMLEIEGFTPMMVPHMVNQETFEGTGFQPRGEENQSYRIDNENLVMIGTSEIPLTGYHAGEIIDPATLPLLYVGYSPSYRMEAGAYGKYSKGLYRVHQFNKLEMYVYCQPADSEMWHQKLVETEEKIAQALEIPYRLVRIAAGDLGSPAFKKFDLEYWSPLEGEYRELMSCSNVTDYQSRRLNIRTRTEDGKTAFVHTLNGTAAAFSRTPIAILENHQLADGSINIPTALRPYYGDTVLK